VTQAITATIPLQVPTAPKMLEELSGQIGKLGPTALNEYVRDFWQRSVLFLDLLRQRGNQHEDMLAHGVSSVLMYDSELVMRGEELPHPVNYSLLRVIPPEGVEIDNRNRPVFVIDPRAGQGPGIGGFKQQSEIGEAFKAGHPVYFAGFTASPVPGQRVEDVARAYAIFIAKVAELHPEALGKPFVFGNCQAGWHAMMAACMRPDVVGPMVIAGAPPVLLGRRSRQERYALSGRLVWRNLARSHDERYRQWHLRRSLACCQFRQSQPSQHVLGQAIQCLG
jgi:uncharacterized protein DUF3141